MSTARYLICVVSIYGKDALQTNQGVLKNKLKINTNVFLVQKYAM